MSRLGRLLAGICWLTAVFLLAACGNSGAKHSGDPAETSLATGLDPDQPSRVARLYFPGNDGRLYIESREVAEYETPADRLTAVAQALLLGPETEGLRAPLADGIEVDGLYLLGDGLVALNLRSADGGPPETTGSQREMLIVYSLVNTLLLDLDGTDRLLLTWNGQQPESFAGQLDVTHPLRPNLDLVAS